MPVSLVVKNGSKIRRLRLRGDARTRVADAHDGHPLAGGILFGGHRDVDLSARRHGVGSVAEQIQQHLLELGRVGHDGRQPPTPRSAHGFVLRSSRGLSSSTVH